MKVDSDPRLVKTHCLFEAELADGRTVVEEIPVGQIRGDLDNPFTRDEVYQKYRADVGDLWTDERARDLFDALASGPADRPVREVTRRFAASSG